MAKADIKEETELGLKHKKADFSEWFSEVIAKTGLADIRYNAKGFIVFRPWSVMSMKQMYRLYEAELERRGHKPALFPALIPEENFRMEAEHVEGFTPEVFWVESVGNEKLPEKLAMRPTSETAMYRMYAMWIRSWRDLPFKIYQSCQVWRHDTKSTRPFIRSREFHWIEGHDAFATKEGAERQVKEDMEITEEVMHQEFGIPFISVQRPEWDKFPGAVHTYAADTLMPDGKVLQQPSTHLLGQNFAKVFNVTYEDKSGKEQLVWQTCYGPAISRIFASVIATHGDDRGLIFPFKIAPVQVIIIPVTPDKAVEKRCKELKESLSKDFKVEVDLADNTAGWKFNQWEMLGVPVRLEIGPREVKSKTITICRRDTGKKDSVPESKIIESIQKTGEDVSKTLKKRADDWFKNKFQTSKTLQELKKALEKGGFVRVNYCSIDRDGEACADRIKDETHGQVRGFRIDKKDKPDGKCIVCGKKANCVVYIAKQY